MLAPKDVKKVYAGFKSFFQGDHLGVEYALASHSQMLTEAGLLQPRRCILRHHAFPRGPVWEGVVIDDFYTISREPALSENQRSASVQHLELAETAMPPRTFLVQMRRQCVVKKLSRRWGPCCETNPYGLLVFESRQPSIHQQGLGFETSWKLGLHLHVPKIPLLHLV